MDDLDDDDFDRMMAGGGFVLALIRHALSPAVRLVHFFSCTQQHAAHAQRHLFKHLQAASSR
jgi:hypothetical protein